MAPTSELIEIELPLLRPLRTAAGSVDRRRSVLIAFTDEGVTGWGEAAPYPGFTAETADDVWQALTAGGSLPPTAAAAAAAARAEQAARAAGEPLWRRLGGTGRAVPASLAVGIGPEEELIDLLRPAVAAGVSRVKLKIAPGYDVLAVQAVREAFPHLAVAVDANASYDDAADSVWRALDDMGLDYIEQPLAATDLEGHAALRRQLTTPLCLDESVVTDQQAAAAIAAGAADMLCVKPGITGLDGALQMVARAREAGMAVKASGLVETSLGKAATVAVASLPDVEHADLIPARYQLEGDIVTEPWTLRAGNVAPRPRPGWGVEVDRELVAAVTRRRAVVRF